MRKIILPFVVLGLLLSQPQTSIAAWEVEQGSRGNELLLQVRNSQRQNLQEVVVEVDQSPGWIQFGTGEVVVGEVLVPEEMQDAIFLFDVAEEAPLGAKGNIKLLVKCSAESWRKEVAVTVIPSTSLPTVNALHQSSPNPSRRSPVIGYQLSKRAQTTLKVYNLAGRLVKTLVNDAQKAGYYRVEWHGNDEQGRQMPGGVYFYRLQAGNFTAGRKLILLR
ncbi:T9SS type A sorting domain-containing protein [candidate division TA06 bacterium]|uniref:T9SS type A sorting domain-containing protein n=1 Tax=candidate division TA06 bacterium TaxID=2250710 RepID=A0A523UXI8_UNCT6|nr:MAG: T9SS type A sorting domain-containing protein [candidate division TA06 bacterium]